MSIWFGEPSLEWANERSEHALIRALGIEMTELTEDSLKGRMPVDHRTRQPAGVLHGGASVALAETLASWGASFTVDPSQFYCVGMEINANHVRPVADGWVYGEARPITRGRTMRRSHAPTRRNCPNPWPPLSMSTRGAIGACGPRPGR